MIPHKKNYVTKTKILCTGTDKYTVMLKYLVDTIICDYMLHTAFVGRWLQI